MAYTHIQSVEGSGNAVTNVDAAALTTVSTGNNIIGAVKYENVSAATVTVTDSAGSTYTVESTQFNDSGYRVATFRCMNAVAGSSVVVNVNLGTSCNAIRVYVTQASGLGAYINTAYGAGGTLLVPGTGTDAMATANLNITSQPARLWGFALDLDGGADPGFGTGFTDRGEFTDATVEDKQILATGNTTATWTSAFGSHTFIVAAQAFTEASSSTYTITANHGTYSVSGSEAYRDIVMAADQGTYTQTGQNATLNKGFTLVADYGSYSVNGSAGLIDLSMSAAAGTYTVTGQDAGLNKTFLLIAQHASYAVAGQAADLVWSNPPAPTPIADSLRARRRGNMTRSWFRRG